MTTGNTRHQRHPEGTIPDDTTTDDPFDVTATEPTGHWLR